MRFIDPTLYASGRSQPELELLAAAGCMALVEPTTWRGLDRRFAESFLDDFERLIVAEARRALGLRLGYAACLGVPPQEARQLGIANRVVELRPRFLGHERVAAIGEPWLSYFDSEVLARRLQTLGAVEIDDLGPPEIQLRVFGNIDPPRTRKGGHIIWVRWPG